MVYIFEIRDLLQDDIFETSRRWHRVWRRTQTNRTSQDLQQTPPTPHDALITLDKLSLFYCRLSKPGKEIRLWRAWTLLDPRHL
jgi:hypothetical protein